MRRGRSLRRWKGGFFARLNTSASTAGPKNRDLEVETGDSFLWRWHGHLDNIKQTGTIMEANGLDKFAFTFSGDSLVTVDIGR
ncbi:hypothetical protein BH20ACI2_BH20ACI2_06670 [soil metagenome]